MHAGALEYHPGASAEESARAVAQPLPDPAGRTAYRIVQEGLTNVRKHACGATQVRVRLTGAPGEDLVVEVTNAAGARTGVQEDGQGLIGLRERVTAAGWSTARPAGGGCTPPELIVAAVRQVAAGHPVLSPAVTGG